MAWNKKAPTSKVLGAVLGATLAVGLMSPVAQADEQKNLVTFGDSYLSNPTPAETLGAKARANVEKQGIQLDSPVGQQVAGYSPNGCGQSATNTPRQIGQMTGLETRDYSCPGAVLYTGNTISATLAQEIDYALRDNALDENTTNVVIQFGFNDSYNWLGQVAAARGIPATVMGLEGVYAEQKGLWMGAMNEAINRIKAAAPQARITVADYPTISKQDTAEQCLLHVAMIPGNVGIPAFWIRDAEVNIHNWAAELAAQRAGENVVFADLRTPTANAGECAPDDSRMIAGVIDFTAETGYNLPVHMTHRGTTHAAEVIASTF